MKYVVNWYSVDFHAVLENGPPLAGARLEQHPFGDPPSEVRSVWVLELERIEALLPQVRDQGLCVTLTSSPVWSGSDPKEPGEPLFGLSVYDDVQRLVDPRDRPIGFAAGSSTG